LLALHTGTISVPWYLFILKAFLYEMKIYLSLNLNNSHLILSFFMKAISAFYLLILILIVFDINAQQKSKITDEWKLGVAMYTFHTVSFPEAIDKVDSAGIHLIEGMTFHRSGKALKDSAISQLSPSGIAQIKKIAENKKVEIGSVYIGGGKTVESWKKEFEIAKQLGAKFVTAEPPANMWDSIDSLAGIYGLKVAIHEHWKGVSAYWHPDSVLAAIKDHPNFGACADLGHWPKSGIDPVEGVKKLKGHIMAIHLKDIAECNNTI